MGTIQAIFENGVFRSTSPVELPEASQVEFEPRLVGRAQPRQNAIGMYAHLGIKTPTLDEFDDARREMAAAMPRNTHEAAA